MPAEEKLKAVQFWNVVSEKLQEIVNNSAADISALAFELEKENAAKMLGNGLEKNANLALANAISSECAATQGQADQTLKLTENSLNRLSSTTVHAGATIGQAAPSTLSALASEISSPTNEVVHSLTMSSSSAITSATNSLVTATLSDPSVVTTSTPLVNSANALTPNTTIMINSSNITVTPDLPADNLMTPQLPSSSGTKLTTNRRGRGRPAVKRDKNEDSDWSPLEERGNRNNRRSYSTAREGLRTSAQRSRKNLLLKELGANEDEEESDEGDLDDGFCGAEDGMEDEEDDEDSDLKNGTSVLDDIHIGIDENPDEDAENKHSPLEKNEKPNAKNKRTRRRRNEGGDNFYPEGGDHSCEFCSRKFVNISSLTTHRWIHTKPYACTECSARFSTKGNLIVHKRRHTGEKPYSCNQCDARFSTKGNLKRHVKTHSGEKPWECTQCGGRFTEKKSLKVHMRRHTGEKPYQCKVCGKRFAQTGILQTHMAMHMDQKAHLCDHCGKSFRQKSQLRLHMMRHEGVRKYQCITCPARFLTKGDLERHNRIHTGERPFVCELCGKTFTRQQSLNEHMNRHYGLKPYECKYCGKNFAEMSACYKHIKQHERSQIPTMQQHQVTVDAADGQKFTVLVHTDQPLDVGSEISVVQQEQGAALPADSHITVAVTDQIGEFAAINLLASASTYQQTF